MKAVCIIVEKDSEKIKAIRRLESLGYKKYGKFYFPYIDEGVQVYFGRKEGWITKEAFDDKELALKYSLTNGYTPISSKEKFMDIE